MKYHIEFDVEFRKNPGPGIYIALEGIDGSGKTTQVERLAEEFKLQGREVVITAEPNEDIETGKYIRQVLRGEIKVPSVTIQYLMTANRIVNHAHVVEPALKRGAAVLSSRSFWSAIPYGMLDKSMESSTAAVIEKNNRHILIAQGILTLFHQFLVADYTFCLDIPVDVALSRMAHTEKKHEIYERRDRLEKIKKGYELLIHEFPEHITKIDGLKTEKEVTQEILKRISSST